MKNNARKIILYTMVLFICSYGTVAIVYSIINKILFEEYGAFSNNSPLSYISFIAISLLCLMVISFLTTSNRRFSDFRIVIHNKLLFNSIFFIYLIIYFFSLYDFIVRYNLIEEIYDGSLINIISLLGYKVAYSNSKLSYTILSIFPIVFYVYFFSSSRFIKLFSKINFIIVMVLLFICGRKEQFLLAFILLFIYFIKKFNFKKRTIIIIIMILLFLLICIVIFLNSVRGDLNNKTIFDILFNSQESYPLVLSAHLALDSNIDIPLDVLVSSLFPASAFSGDVTTMGYIRQIIFGESGHGPVYTVIGFAYFYFPISIFIIIFVNNICTILVNTFQSFGDEFLGFILFTIIKYFIFLRNGNLNFLLLDLMFLFCFSSLCFIFKHHSMKRNI